MQVLPNLLPVGTYEVSCDWRFEPPQYLANARGTSASSSKFKIMGHPSLVQYVISFHPVMFLLNRQMMSLMKVSYPMIDRTSFWEKT